MPMPSSPPTVDEYLKALPPDFRKVMEQARKAIREAAPAAEEVISYQIPTYKYLGPLVHIAAYKNHCSFFGVSKSILGIYKEDLSRFHISGTTIHFAPDNPLSASLVKKIVKTRIKENEERKAMKDAKKSPSKKAKIKK